MGNYNFKRDIKVGKKGELMVVEHYEKQGYKLLEQNNTSDYDLRFGLFDNAENLIHEFTTEVKFDSFFRLKNIAIEMAGRSKPTGLSVTKADWYAYVFNKTKEIWEIEVSVLKNLLYKAHTVSLGGDKGSNTVIFLFDREEMREHFNITQLS